MEYMGGKRNPIHQIAALIQKQPKNASKYIIRARGHLFKALIKNDSPVIQDFLLKELTNPGIIVLVDTYWQKAGLVLQYLENEMTEEEETQYEELKKQDDEFALFEKLVKKWGRTRIITDDSQISDQAETYNPMQDHIVADPVRRAILRARLLRAQSKQFQPTNE